MCVCMIVSLSALSPLCLSIICNRQTKFELTANTRSWTDRILINIMLSVKDEINLCNMPKSLIYSQNLPIILYSKK